MTSLAQARWRKALLPVAMPVVALTVLAACGNSSPKAAGAATPANAATSAAQAGDPATALTTMPGMTMPAGGGAAAAGPAVGSDTVAIKNFAFAPGNITVKVGTTVTWTNQDGDAHTVTSMDNGPLHSPTLNTGDTYHYTFTKAGTYSYLCTIHPFMTATVVVTA